MPLNQKESYEELKKYRQFYSTFHSAYELLPENFIKVPPKTIIVSTFHDNEISSYDQIQLYMEMIIRKQNYLIKSLLTENDDIPEYHKFHNKTIYMPGSCIPNISLEFINKKENELIMGILDITELYRKTFFDAYRSISTFKEEINKESIVPSDMVNSKTLSLKDLIQIVHDYKPDEYGYIIFIDGCAGINYSNNKYLERSKISEADKIKIKKNNKNENILKLSNAYTKYNRECILDSLQKFTAKFSFYDKTPIDFSRYPVDFNFSIEDVYKKKYKKDLRDVNRYLSNLSDVVEENELLSKSKSINESIGSLGPLSSNVAMSLSGKDDENIFDKYFKQEVTEILSPKKVRKTRKSPLKTQILRRSSRIASARKMYDGKRRKSSKLKSRSKHVKSNKHSSPSSNVIILQRSTNPDKKFMAIVGNKTVHFGAKNFSDFTIHKDIERKKRYISRHRRKENWNKSGLKTAGFWSFWLLWNKPSFVKSLKDIEKRFNVRIIYKR